MKFSKVVFSILTTMLCALQLSAAPLRKNIFAEYHILPDSSGVQLSIVYRIGYDALIFSKDGQQYTAGFTITIERSDSADKFIARDIVEKRISVRTIEETKSEVTLQGILKYPFSGKKEKVLVSFHDASGSREINRYHFQIDQHTGLSAYHDLLVVGPNADGNNSLLANYNGVIPFSQKPFSIIVIADSAAKTKPFLRLQSKDTVFMLKRDTAFAAALGLDSTLDGIAVRYLAGTSGKYLCSVFSSANLNLLPGGYSLSLAEADTVKNIRLSQASVFWLDKPRSLDFQDFAYRIMNKIDNSFAESPYYKKSGKTEPVEMLLLWKRYDPTPNTTFNERLAEFFKRVDYSLEHFASIKGNDGAETDRGEMYIRLGPPASIERSTTRSGKIAEIWKYKGLNKEFVFVDLAGNGSFDLMEQK